MTEVTTPPEAASTNGQAPASPAAVELPPLWRGAILVDGRHQVDVVFPSAIPISAGMTGLLEDLNEVAAQFGYAPRDVETAYGLQREGGKRLDLSLSLDQQGIPDGRLLLLAPRPAPEAFDPVYEDLSAGLGADVEATTKPITSAGAVLFTGIAIAVLVAIGSALLVRAHALDTSWWIAPVIAALLTAAMLGAGVVAGRAGRAALSDALVLGSVAPAVATAVSGLPAPIGAAHAGLSWLAATVIIIGLTVWTSRWWLLSAFVGALGVSLGAGALVRAVWAVPGSAIAITVVTTTLTVVLLAPKIANRAAGFVPPELQMPTGEGVFERGDDEPANTISPVLPDIEPGQPYPELISPQDVRKRARNAVAGYLGVVLAAMVALPFAVWGSITPNTDGRWAVELIIAATALGLLGCAWVTRDWRLVAAMACGSFAAATATVLKFVALEAHPVSATLAALGALGAAIVLLLVISWLVARRGTLSPVVRRLLEILFLLSMTSVYPLMFYVVNIYSATRTRG